MRYHAFATDFDSTLPGRQSERRNAGRPGRLLATGRKLILVTGRTRRAAERLLRGQLFHRVVAENGALLYNPATRKLLAPPFPMPLRALRERGVQRVRGPRDRFTDRPEETTVLTAISQLGLELQLIFNRGGVVLPAGVNKASGLNAAAVVVPVASRSGSDRRRGERSCLHGRQRVLRRWGTCRRSNSKPIG